MESSSLLRLSEVCKGLMIANHKAEIDMMRKVQQHKKEHDYFLARLDNQKQVTRAKMEEYTARKRAIYKERISSYQESGEVDDLGPYYRLPHHSSNPVRDDVFQSGVILHGLMYPGAFPHNVEVKRRKSYQNQTSLRRDSVLKAKVNHNLITEPGKRPSLPERSILPRATSAPSRLHNRASMRNLRSSSVKSHQSHPAAKSGKWTEDEMRILSRVPLYPKQYLLVMTPKGHPRFSSQRPALDQRDQTNSATKRPWAVPIRRRPRHAPSKFPKSPDLARELSMNSIDGHELLVFD